MMMDAAALCRQLVRGLDDLRSLPTISPAPLSPPPARPPPTMVCLTPVAVLQSSSWSYQVQSYCQSLFWSTFSHNWDTLFERWRQLGIPAEVTNNAATAAAGEKARGGAVHVTAPPAAFCAWHHCPKHAWW